MWGHVFNTETVPLLAMGGNAPMTSAVSHAELDFS